MIVAIAKADPKLLLLTQYTGWMGYTIDGIGYGDNLDVRYDLDGAKNEPKNAFKFEPPITNPLLGQTGFPENPAGDVAAAIRQGVQTGVIYHPIMRKDMDIHLMTMTIGVVAMAFIGKPVGIMAIGVIL